MICCPSSFGRKSGGREDGRGFKGEERREQEMGVGGNREDGRVFRGEERREQERRLGAGGRKREREELTTPSTSVFGRGGFGNVGGGEEDDTIGGFGNGGGEEETKGGGEEDYGEEFPVFSAGTFFPVSDEFP